MIRILYYIPLLLLGGTERQLLNLVTNLDRRRFEPAVWTEDGNGPVAGALRDGGVPVHVMAVDYEDSQALERAVCWIRSAEAPVFHSFGYGDDWRDVVLARLAGIPVCLSRRGNLRHWEMAPPRFPETLRSAGSDLVVTNCRAVAEHCERNEGVPREKLRVIYNGVEAPEQRRKEEARAELGLRPGEPVVGNVAGLRPVKGGLPLLSAFRHVADAVPDAKLVICGDGELRADLERARKDLKLTERVIFTGFRRDVGTMYSALDVYASASFSEGFSNAILEAMHCGLPVAATAAGGTAECVTHEATGLLAQPGDPEGLSTAMIRLLRDHQLRERMGTAGRVRVRERFSIPQMVRAYERLYDETLSRRGLS